MSIIPKPVQKIQVLLRYYKNSGYFGGGGHSVAQLVEALRYK